MIDTSSGFMVIVLYNTSGVTHIIDWHKVTMKWPGW